MTAYTLFSQAAPTGSIVGGSASPFNFGVQFTVSESIPLTGIWFYSPSGADALPHVCGLWDAVAQTQIAGTENSSPAWSGAAGSGWVKCAYTDVTVSPGTTYEAVVLGEGTSTGWYERATAWWGVSGPGADGITSGPLSGPSNADAVTGQNLVSGEIDEYEFPSSAAGGNNYWVDIEVTPAAPAAPAYYSMRFMP